MRVFVGVLVPNLTPRVVSLPAVIIHIAGISEPRRSGFRGTLGSSQCIQKKKHTTLPA